MNFLQLNDFNKISKYVIRLRKSIETNDVNKVREYYDHLKYHIQLGGVGDNLDELTKKFNIVDDIIKKISSKPDNKTFNQLNDELVKCNNEKEDYSKQIKKLFRISKIFGKDSDKNIKDLEEKITKYTNIIHQIENESKVTNLNETGELDKVESALKEIFSRLRESNSLKEQLENITKENNELQNKIEKQKNITKELERVNTDFKDLEKLVEQKDKEIVELTDKIKELEIKVEQMEEDINNKNKHIDKVANEFDEKIRILLKTIYGNDSLVNELMQGVKVGETAGN